MDALLAEAFLPSPIPTLLRDSLPGPIDCSFLLYHYLGACLATAPPPPLALLASLHPASHHRAALRKALGPARSDSVATVCAWEVQRRLGPQAAPEALAGALLAAASGGSGAAPGLCLAVEDVQSLCEVAGGVAQGLAVLRALAAAQPRGLLLRMAGACDWRLDAGGALLAPTLGGALEHWARTVILARPLPSGFSREAHGRLELVRRSGGSGAGSGEGAPALSALFKVSADGSVADPSTAF